MNSFSSSQMTPSCKSAFMAFRHRSRSSKKRLYAPANDYAKALSRWETFGEKTQSNVVW